MKIDSDLGRFKEILKGRVRGDLKKFATSEDMIGQQGAKVIKIPLKSIDLPRFMFGGRGMGGTGMGPGENGDPLGQGQGKPGQGDQAGEGEMEHEYAEFTAQELADMIKEELQLPDLEPKGKGSTSSEKAKWNEINRVGNDGLRHFKRSYKEALKRSISTGIYNPDHPVVIPQRGDFRYKTNSIQPTPEENAVCLFLMDCSGSMDDDKKHLAKSTMFWIDLILRRTYKDLETRFFLHDTKAWECDRKDFFSVNTGGGTQISSIYKLIWNVMQKDHPFSDWNVFIYQASDSDNYSNADNALCVKMLEESILPNCNVLSYSQIKANNGDYYNYLQSNASKKVRLSSIDKSDDVMGAIKTFFSEQ